MLFSHLGNVICMVGKTPSWFFLSITETVFWTMRYDFDFGFVWFFCSLSAFATCKYKHYLFSWLNFFRFKTRTAFFTKIQPTDPSFFFDSWLIPKRTTLRNKRTCDCNLTITRIERPMSLGTWNRFFSFKIVLKVTLI